MCPICSQDEDELREQVERILGAGLDCRTWGVGAFGDEGQALRYSLLIPTAAPLISVLVCILGARNVRGDLDAAREESG